MRTDGRLTSILAKESNSIILWLICIGNFLCELIGRLFEVYNFRRGPTDSDSTYDERVKYN